MPDLLVNLLKLPLFESHTLHLLPAGVEIRRAQPFELSKVRQFVSQHFSTAWADEITVGFSQKPVSVHIATLDRAIIGFAAHECTRRSFFGPMGVDPTHQHQGIGTALLIASLLSLRDLGYVYGIIGGAGPVEFYRRTVGAIVIPDSEPGIYADLLK